MKILGRAAQWISVKYYSNDYLKIKHFYNCWKLEIYPEILVIALVLGEDKRFWTHQGIDLKAILRAVYQTCFCGCIQGGSTLEQQLVRTITAKYDPTLKRKLREMILALCIQTIMPKKIVPHLYLSLAYFGWM